MPRSKKPRRLSPFTRSGTSTLIAVRMAKRLFLPAIFLAGLCFGQTGVVKSEGQPIPGAAVRAAQGDRILLTLTDDNGAYKFEGMAPGTWNVEVSMFGFDISRREALIAS